MQVDAKHFTPQSRNRVFVIAVDLARHELNQHPFPSDNLHRHKVRDAYLRHPKLPWFFFDFPAMPARKLSLRYILEEVPAEYSSWWDKEQMDYFWSLLEHDHKVRLKSVLAAGTNHVFTAVRRLRRRHKREQIFNIRFDGLASCLRTPRGGSSTQYVIVTVNGKIQGRRLTGLEAARLQGVCLPDYSPDYKLVGSETDIRFAFGDAVCVPALKWVVEHSIEQLLPTQGVRNGKSSSLQKHLVFD